MQLQDRVSSIALWLSDQFSQLIIRVGDAEEEMLGITVRRIRSLCPRFLRQVSKMRPGVLHGGARQS